jgi:hypothetical protein
MQPSALAYIQPPPHLSFVGAKTRPTSLMSNKNAPGRSEEHTDALALNAEFVPAPKTEIIEPTQTEFAPEPEPESPRLA